MTNRLADEASPYLLQHADNPVDWYSWGDEAFAAARGRDVPVLLSVGYSACHWCHVMAHESFESTEIAALMNELFVNIKVDREERPDVDAIYMQAVLAMTGHGGWPMTVFLTPAGEPFFGGTYFPPEDRGGMRGFPSILRAVANAWRAQRDEVTMISAQLVATMRAPQLQHDRTTPSEATLDASCERLLSQLDTTHGGFGRAPKFPQPAAVDLLLRRFAARGNRRYLEAALLTLGHMARGGLHDQLGGGFHRYTVDATWTVPHFEKMLYDNAQLAPVYLHAYQLNGDAECRAVAASTCDWMLREMSLPGGGFAASQDADSPGGEGSYFVWTQAQLREVLGSESVLASALFGVAPEGNFENGRSVLTHARTDVAPSVLDSIRARLLAARAARSAPARDDKLLTSWNALAIAALAECGGALDRDDWLNAAERTAALLLRDRDEKGGLQRAVRDRGTPIPAFLEDVAYLAAAMVTLYDTASGSDSLVVRPRTLDDTPIPAGQSALADALLRLAALTGDTLLRDEALQIIAPLTMSIERSPLALPALACAADRFVAPPREIAIVGPRDDPRTRALLAAVRRRWHPNAVLAWGEPADVPLLAGRPLVGGRPAAYVCELFACAAPVTDPEQLATLLG